MLTTWFTADGRKTGGGDPRECQQSEICSPMSSELMTENMRHGALPSRTNVSIRDTFLVSQDATHGFSVKSFVSESKIERRISSCCTLSVDVGLMMRWGQDCQDLGMFKSFVRANHLNVVVANSISIELMSTKSWSVVTSRFVLQTWTLDVSVSFAVRFLNT